MPKDHFVAQTYLKHWCNPATEMLHGIQKETGKEFPCHTKDVCRKWDWDTNPTFKGAPRLLDDFKKIFEPNWNISLTSMRAGTISSHDKFVFSGYWATLITCTPTWHAHAVEIYEVQLENLIPELARAFARTRPEYREYIEDALAKNRIRPNVDKDYVKGILTQQLTDITFSLYAQEWMILRNRTNVPFITSDNPSTILPRSPNSLPLKRVLPIAPDIAILTQMDPAKAQRGGPPPDLSRPLRGVYLKDITSRRSIVRINRAVAMNAEDTIFSSHQNRRISQMIRRHRGLEVGTEHFDVKIRNGRISGATMVIRRKGQQAKSSNAQR